MTDWTMQSTEHDLSRLLGDFLRRRTASAKDLARLIDCDPRTAEGFRAGRYWPSARHWKLIARQFGRDALDAVFSPEIDATVARLEQEQRILEEQLHAIQARRRQAEGVGPGPSERRAPGQDHADPNQLNLFEPRSFKRSD